MTRSLALAFALVLVLATACIGPQNVANTCPSAGSVARPDESPQRVAGERARPDDPHTRPACPS